MGCPGSVCLSLPVGWSFLSIMSSKLPLSLKISVATFNKGCVLINRHLYCNIKL